MLIKILKRVDKIMKNFYYNAKMQAALDEKPSVITTNDGVNFFRNYAIITIGKFKFSVSCDNDYIFSLFKKCVISVDDTFIYDYVWKFEISKEMEKELEIALSILEKYNEKCDSEKLSKRYREHLKSLEKMEKERESLKKQREQDKLNQLFK